VIGRKRHLFTYAVAAFLMGSIYILIRHQGEDSVSCPDESRDPPLPTEANPRYTRFLKRYALAEIATIVGIPVALIALLLTNLTIREAARQVELGAKQLEASQEQAQPHFRLVEHESDTFIRIPDELTLTMNGAAAEPTPFIYSIFFTKQPDGSYQFIRENWWVETQEPDARSIRWKWRSEPERLRRFEDDPITYLTIILVDYFDVFQVHGRKYFGFSRDFDSNSWSSAHSILDAAAANRCLHEVIFPAATSPLPTKAINNRLLKLAQSIYSTEVFSMSQAEGYNCLHTVY
jgi:hypothetical protein